MENKHEPIISISSLIEAPPFLTKREYFAGLAMQGLLAYPGDFTSIDYKLVTVTLAKRSIEFADALLLELSNETIKTD